MILFHLILPFIGIFMTAYFNWRVKRFMVLHCPRNRMSCIGLFKRNVLNIRQTLSLFYTCCLSCVVGAVLQIVFILEKDTFSQTSRFWIWNIKELFFNDVWFLVFPFLLEVPSNIPDGSKSRGFYVSKPALEPRRLGPRFITHPTPIFDASNLTVLRTRQPAVKDKMRLGPRKIQNSYPILSLSIPNTHQKYTQKEYNCTVYCKNQRMISRTWSIFIDWSVNWDIKMLGFFLTFRLELPTKK